MRIEGEEVLQDTIVGMFVCKPTLVGVAMLTSTGLLIDAHQLYQFTSQTQLLFHLIACFIYGYLGLYELTRARKAW